MKILHRTSAFILPLFPLSSERKKERFRRVDMQNRSFIFEKKGTSIAIKIPYLKKETKKMTRRKLYQLTQIEKETNKQKKIYETSTASQQRKTEYKSKDFNYN